MKANYDELKMRESKAPEPRTLWQLFKVIRAFGRENDHDYGTAVYAVSIAATATFNYMASRLGITGFQASCADMDILRRTRRIAGPFMIVDAKKMLYPQFDLHKNLSDAMDKWRPWAAEEARKQLAQLGTADSLGASPDVQKHWEMLAAFEPETEAE